MVIANSKLQKLEATPAVISYCFLSPHTIKDMHRNAKLEMPHLAYSLSVQCDHTGKRNRKSSSAPQQSTAVFSSTARGFGLNTGQEVPMVQEPRPRPAQTIAVPSACPERRPEISQKCTLWASACACPPLPSERLLREINNSLFPYVQVCETDRKHPSHCLTSETAAHLCSLMPFTQQEGNGITLDDHQQMHGQENIQYKYTLEFYSAVKKMKFARKMHRTCLVGSATSAPWHPFIQRFWNV